MTTRKAREKWYVAVLQQRETDAISCLTRWGMPHDIAEQYVALAAENESEVIVAPQKGGGITLLIVPFNGALHSFLAFTRKDCTHDDEESALAFAEELRRDRPEKLYVAFTFEPLKPLTRRRASQKGTK